MKKIRAYYKPDMETDDWPIYFYPCEKEYVWRMDIDKLFVYEFYIPFFDDMWVIQKMTDENLWEDI